MPGKKKIGELLVEAGIIDALQLKAALGKQKQWGGRLGTHLVEMRFVDEATLARFLSTQTRVPAVDLSKARIAPELFNVIPMETCEKLGIVPIGLKAKTVWIAMADPNNLAAIDEIQFSTGLKVEPRVAPEAAIRKILKAGGTPEGGAEGVQRSPEVAPAPSGSVVAQGWTPPGGESSPGIVGEQEIDFQEPPPPDSPEEILEPAPEEPPAENEEGASSPPEAPERPETPPPLLVDETYETMLGPPPAPEGEPELPLPPPSPPPPPEVAAEALPPPPPAAPAASDERALDPALIDNIVGELAELRQVVEALKKPPSGEAPSKEDSLASEVERLKAAVETLRAPPPPPATGSAQDLADQVITELMAVTSQLAELRRQTAALMVVLMKKGVLTRDEIAQELKRAARAPSAGDQ